MTLTVVHIARPSPRQQQVEQLAKQWTENYNRRAREKVEKKLGKLKNSRA